MHSPGTGALDFCGKAVSEALSQAVKLLTAAGIEDPRTDARLLLLNASRLSAVSLISDPQQPLDSQSASIFGQHMMKRLDREPVSRILGRKAFWKSEFLVTPAVLDPRPATETIVEIAVKELAGRRTEELGIADLGSGSGALICSLLLEFPNAVGSACDISPEALAITIKNAEILGVQRRLVSHACQWSQLPGQDFNLIVSNPPYIRTGVMKTLDQEVRWFDPALALDGGDDGLDAYRSLAPVLRSKLADTGKALIEIGYDQAQDVCSIFSATGLKVGRTYPDAAGLDRVIELEAI